MITHSGTGLALGISPGVRLLKLDMLPALSEPNLKHAPNHAQGAQKTGPA